MFLKNWFVCFFCIYDIHLVYIVWGYPQNGKPRTLASRQPLVATCYFVQPRFLLSYAFSFASFFLLVLLPNQKQEAQRRLGFNGRFLEGRNCRRNRNKMHRQFRVRQVWLDDSDWLYYCIDIFFIVILLHCYIVIACYCYIAMLLLLYYCVIILLYHTYHIYIYHDYHILHCDYYFKVFICYIYCMYYCCSIEIDIMSTYMYV